MAVEEPIKSDLTLIALQQQIAQLTEQLRQTEEHLEQERDRRQTAEALLFQIQNQIETQVQERTAELSRVSTQLQQELSAYEGMEAELRANESALNLSQERLNSILDSLEDVVWSIVPETAQLLYLNAAAEKVYGRSVAEFILNSDLWQQVIHPEDRKRVEQANAALRATGSQDLEYRIIWPQGEVRWIRVRARLVKGVNGELLRIDGITTDITDRHRIQEQLQYDALHDGLTGLANRALLMARLDQVIKQSQRQEDKLFAILFLDLDRFKVINDSLGHLIGDQLLIAVARRLENCHRARDMIARLGGDEFVILLEGLTSAEDAVEIARRIHQALAPPILLDGHEIFITVSIGIAIGSAQNCPSSDQGIHLLRDADTAMYRAKARGKGLYEIFVPSMHVYALKRWQLETDLRQALDHREISVYYQPIVNLATQRIEGFEALLRWQHPELGLVSPAEIIPIAEETGLIVLIDRWVLQSACQQLKLWREQFSKLSPLIMSVNLSGKHFAQPGLIQFIDQVLEENNLPGSAVKLEITETIVIENSEPVMLFLKQLQERGIQVSLDDFGTGYSSLSYLHYFPFNTLKIDRSFVKRLENQPSRREIVRTIIDLGLTMGMTVVAEGIETRTQFEQLQQLNCPYGQGYWFAQPMPSEAMTVFLGQPRLFSTLVPNYYRD